MNGTIECHPNIRVGGAQEEGAAHAGRRPVVLTYHQARVGATQSCDFLHAGISLMLPNDEHGGDARKRKLARACHWGQIMRLSADWE